MIKSFSLIVLTMFTSTILIAQTKDSFAVRQWEQKEINSYNRVKKEVQQKQLIAPPERLNVNRQEETKSLQKSREKVAKGSSAHAVRRNGRCHKKLKPGSQKR